MAGQNLVGVGAGDSPLVLGCSVVVSYYAAEVGGPELVRCEAQPAKRMTTVARLDHCCCTLRNALAAHNPTR